MGEMVSFSSNGDTCDGSLATPSAGSGPGVIVGNDAGEAAMIHALADDGTSAAEGVQTAIRGIESAGGSVEVFDYP